MAPSPDVGPGHEPRTCLYAPGDDARKLAKAVRAGADLVIADLEDAVAPGAKPRARSVVAAWLDEAHRVDSAGVPRWARVNGTDVEEDLAAVVRPGLAGVVVPKCEGAEQLARVDAVLRSLEVQRSLPAASIPVAAIVESARGLLAADEIARSPRVARLHLGEADLCGELGVTDLTDAELAPLRLQVVVASAAARLEPPTGPVHTALGDEEGLRRTSDVLRRLGFGGRSVVHPRQIGPVHETFAPSAAAVAAAAAVLRRFSAEKAGLVGVYVDDDGAMVDAAVVRAAQRVVVRARRDG